MSHTILAPLVPIPDPAGSPSRDFPWRLTAIGALALVGILAVVLVLATGQRPEEKPKTLPDYAMDPARAKRAEIDLVEEKPLEKLVDELASRPSKIPDENKDPEPVPPRKVEPAPPRKAGKIKERTTVVDPSIFDEPKKEPATKSPEKKRFIPVFVDDKEIVERVKKAGGRIGAVTVSLAWKNRNDLDLHVLTANGEDICFHRRHSACGGTLDVDQNVSPTTLSPVENVFWPKDSPPKGPLKVYVHHYRNHGLADCRDPTRFVVRVQVGDKVKTYEGAISYLGHVVMPVAPNPHMAFVAEVLVPARD